MLTDSSRSWQTKYNRLKKTTLGVVYLYILIYILIVVRDILIVVRDSVSIYLKRIHLKLYAFEGSFCDMCHGVDLIKVSFVTDRFHLILVFH